MRKAKFKPVLLLVVFIAAIALCFTCLFGTKTAKAENIASKNANTYISAYKISYDIGSNRLINVTEDITVNFDNGTGFYRIIPVNAGEQVKNVKVYELYGGETADVYYDVSLESNAVYLDIGDYNYKSGDYSYRVTYDYCLTKAQEGKNLLALTPIGTDWPCRIENVDIELKLPDGYINDSALCFVNYQGQKTDFNYTESTVDGRTVLYANIDMVSSGSEVRIDLSFKDGSLTTYSDFTPYWFVIAGAIILVLLIVLKLFVFNKSYITPVVNYDAPDKMDPLLMGKLIDNRVNSEDITSLIFYWASKGYIKINLDDKEDPTLIRIVKDLPATSASYELVMFNRLFESGDAVKPSQLKGSFYKVVECVTAQVNSQAKGLYDSTSIGISIIFALIGGLLLGLAPMLISFTQISDTFFYLTAFISLIPALLIYGATETVMYYKLKLKRPKLILFSLGIVLLCFIFSLIYILMMPDAIMGILPKILLCIICCAIIVCSVLLISKTKEYTEKLNDIVGFRNFISLAEKDQLEMMLEEDPQFYYHILPYAQVLGVSDKWEDKFRDLTVEPPQWLTGNIVTTYLEFRLVNNIIRGSMMKMSANMIARPSSSGLSGGGHGGFGGFSGGGHGGGGGGFR